MATSKYFASVIPLSFCFYPIKLNNNQIKSLIISHGIFGVLYVILVNSGVERAFKSVFYLTSPAGMCIIWLFWPVILIGVCKRHCSGSCLLSSDTQLTVVLLVL